jgi:hypothetical protein
MSDHEAFWKRVHEQLDLRADPFGDRWIQDYLLEHEGCLEELVELESVLRAVEEAQLPDPVSARGSGRTRWWFQPIPVAAAIAAVTVLSWFLGTSHRDDDAGGELPVALEASIPTESEPASSGASRILECRVRLVSKTPLTLTELTVDERGRRVLRRDRSKERSPEEAKPRGLVAVNISIRDEQRSPR